MIFFADLTNLFLLALNIQSHLGSDSMEMGETSPFTLLIAQVKLLILNLAL